MGEPIRLALLMGSAREGRFCDTVTAWAAAEIGRDPAFALEIVDPRAPGEVESILARADGFVVVTPEYNHGYPAPLKALIDRFGRPWRAKPVAFVSYGGISGGLRAVEQLRLVFAELHAVGIRDGVSFAGARQRFDESGRPLDTEGPRQAMATLLRHLAWWALALREARAARPYGEPLA